MYLLIFKFDPLTYYKLAQDRCIASGKCYPPSLRVNLVTWPALGGEIFQRGWTQSPEIFTALNAEPETFRAYLSLQ